MRRFFFFLLIVATIILPAAGEQHEQLPKFVDSHYQIPETSTPAPRQAFWDFIDIGVLFAALCAASLLSLKNRSRKGITCLMIFSLVYFGFWRRGCVCSVGSIGNIALAAADPNYTVPVSVLVFFFLPMIFTLFFGRSFCGAVCPLGAIQDLFIIKPLRIPSALEAGMRMFAYLYLFAAIIMAATGTMLLICRYDPFITLFRFNGNVLGWILAISFIIVSIFIARPYCRFICPYGAILRILGKLSKYRVTIAPDKCVNCRLCEKACPYNAITQPVKDMPVSELAENKRKFLFFAILCPLLIIAGAWLSMSAYPALAKAAGIPVESQSLGMKLTVAAGALFGLILTCGLIGSVITYRRKDYEARRGDCLSCGRCFDFCPNEVYKKETVKNGLH